MAWDVKAAVFVAASVLVSGCGQDGLDGMLSSMSTGNDDGVARPGPGAMTIASKGFTVAGPAGFCVDPGATRDTDTGAFVLLGSCAVISGDADNTRPAHPAVLTASLTPNSGRLDEADLDRLAGFFSSEAGHAALARSSDARVELLDLGREPGLVLVHASDGAGDEQLAGDYWRGVFETGGKLVTVTVSGFAATPLDDATGQGLVRDFVTAIRSANGAPLAASQPAPAAARAPLPTEPQVATAAPLNPFTDEAPRLPEAETSQNPLKNIGTGIGNFLDRLL